jgi:hypothetical protein
VLCIRGKLTADGITFRRRSVMQDSSSVHGTSLRLETPETLAGHRDAGWGVDVFLRKPAYESFRQLEKLLPEERPGCPCHFAIPTLQYPTDGRPLRLLDIGSASAPTIAEFVQYTSMMVHLMCLREKI